MTKSALEEPEGSNAFEIVRLEILGSAILTASLTSYIIEIFPRLTPSGLERLRSAVSSKEHLAQLAVKYGLPEKLQALRGDVALTHTPNSSAQAELFKAYIGAASRGHRPDAVNDWIRQSFDGPLRTAYAMLKDDEPNGATAPMPPPSTSRIVAASQPAVNAISLLEQWRVRDMRSRTVVYNEAQRIGGAPHQPLFQVVCLVNGTESSAGIAGKKKTARAVAAQNMAIKLGLLETATQEGATPAKSEVKMEL